MFGLDRLRRNIKYTDERVDNLRDETRTKYNDLLAKHEYLLAALGLVEQVTPRRVSYVKKGGPEKEGS